MARSVILLISGLYNPLFSKPYPISSTMKTKYLTLALLLLSTAAFAQTAFTKATLDGILKDYHKNPHDFFVSYCSPDFRYTNMDGSFGYLPELLKASVNDKVETSEILDQKIIQSGDVAVVSGIHVQERKAADGTKNTRRVVCTYTFQRQGGNGSATRWRFVAAQQGNIASNQPDQLKADEKAIKNIIESESSAYHQRNAGKAVSYWLKAPYISHDYTQKGLSYLRGYPTVPNAIRAYIKAHPELATDKTVYKNHDYLIHVNGNSAWATFITDATAGGKKSQSYNARYVEKANGAWKLVAVTGKPAP